MDYLVDDNFDLVIPLQKITDKSDLLFQQIRLLLNTWTNDFLYDITMGMPYEDSIIGGGDIDVTEIEAIYYRKISALQHFYSLENFSISININREILISFIVYSTDGVSKTFSMVV